MSCIILLCNKVSMDWGWGTGHLARLVLPWLSDVTMQLCCICFTVCVAQNMNLFRSFPLSDADVWWWDRNFCLSTRQPIDYGSLPSITSTTNVPLKNALCRQERLTSGHLGIWTGIIIDSVQSYIKNTSYPTAEMQGSESHAY